jgi:hypothetical protein
LYVSSISCKYSAVFSSLTLPIISGIAVKLTFRHSHGKAGSILGEMIVMRNVIVRFDISIDLLSSVQSRPTIRPVTPAQALAVSVSR